MRKKFQLHSGVDDALCTSVGAEVRLVKCNRFLSRPFDRASSSTVRSVNCQAEKSEAFSVTTERFRHTSGKW